MTRYSLTLIFSIQILLFGCSKNDDLKGISQGYVFDAETNRPLEGALVQLYVDAARGYPSPVQQTTTDSKGYFSLIRGTESDFSIHQIKISNGSDYSPVIFTPKDDGQLFLLYPLGYLKIEFRLKNSENKFWTAKLISGSEVLYHFSNSLPNVDVLLPLAGGKDYPLELMIEAGNENPREPLILKERATIPYRDTSNVVFAAEL